MGTRSVVSFYDDGQPIAGVYRQYDGYLDGRGKELADFLSARTLVNGFGGDKQTADNTANGIGDLAAQWVATEKRGEGDKLQLGNVYLQAAEEGDSGHDYTYRIDSADHKEPEVTVWSWGRQLLDRGSVAEFAELVAKGDKAIDEDDGEVTP